MLPDILGAIDRLLKNNWLKLVVPLTALALALAIGLGVKVLVFRLLRRWAGEVPTRTRAILVQTLSRVANVWILILALHIALSSSALPGTVASNGSKVLASLWVISLTVMVARLAAGLLRYYGAQVGDSVLRVTTLTENLAGLGVAILGILILLRIWGFEITPVLTALGVGGLAVALALQDTLSNLFAGFYISIAGQVRVGDYIRLDGGQEGYVTDITWRSTTIRALANNLVIVPNAKLAQAIVTNYHLPERRMSLPIAVGVSYDSDPDQVERVLLEEVRAAVGSVPGLLAVPAPAVRLIPGFGDSSLNFTLICHIAEFVDQYPVQHELRKRILKRLRAEGINIPFPTRSVYLSPPSTPR